VLALSLFSATAFANAAIFVSNRLAVQEKRPRLQSACRLCNQREPA
jgi:hypothetical protein